MIFQIGHKPSEETKAKIRLTKLGSKNPMFGVRGEKASNWRGETVGNKGLHKWVRQKLPMPQACQLCNISKPEELSNKTGIYSRELKNWWYLCRKCHRHYDGTVKYLRPTPKSSEQKCPKCKSWNTRKKGYGRRGQQYFLCNNCNRKWSDS